MGRRLGELTKNNTKCMVVAIERVGIVTSSNRGRL